MKSFLALALLSISFTSFAGIIRCDGETTMASMRLTLPSSASSIGQGEYSFKEKVVPTSLNSYGIQSDNETKTEGLTYKFTTLKKHKLAGKNSKLAFIIKQDQVSGDPFSFQLNENHEALLVDQSSGNSVVLDKMNCRELSN